MAEFKTRQILLNKNANLSWDNLRVGKMIKINLSENNYVYSIIVSPARFSGKVVPFFKGRQWRKNKNTWMTLYFLQTHSTDIKQTEQKNYWAKSIQLLQIKGHIF